MTKQSIEEIEQKELEKLSKNEEIFNLEDLILDGIDNKIPITFDYPLPNGSVKKMGAMIRPLTASEWNTCSMKAIRQNKSMAVEVVKLSLMGTNGETIKNELIEKMPVGVITGLFDKISEISGIKNNEEEQNKLIMDMMGF